MSRFEYQNVSSMSWPTVGPNCLGVLLNPNECWLRTVLRGWRQKLGPGIVDMLPERLKRAVSRLPIVRLLRTHKEERAEAEREREQLAAEQHEIARRIDVTGWLADVPRRRMEPNHHGD